jgi:hypothetical protein
LFRGRSKAHACSANNATGMPMSEVQKKKAKPKPICAIAKPENPARMLPGKWRLPCPRASFFPLLRPA